MGQEPPPMYSTEEFDRKAAKSTKGTKKAKGRFHAINTFADFSLASLDRAEIAVWLLLWRDTMDGTARTSQQGGKEKRGANAELLSR